MSTAYHNLGSIAAFPLPASAGEAANWYAVHTMSRHEKRIAAQFVEKGVQTFLPILREVRRWSDRKSQVEVPLFTCYAFVRIAQTTPERLKVLRTPGVLGFVGSEGHGTPIPDQEMDCLRAAMNGKHACAPHRFLAAGTRVRVCGGSLDGVEGILVRQGSDESVVLSLSLLKRSVAVRVEGYRVEALS